MTTKRRVTIACCRASYDQGCTDLYPDPDSELMVAAFTRHGATATMRSWDDATVDWSGTDAVIIRSTWDSVDRPDEYLAWARQVAQVTTLINPYEMVAWNLDKRYLGDLCAEGLPVVPTTFVEPGASWRAPTGDFVVKPTVSAGGRDTALYGPAHRMQGHAHVARLLAAGRTVMVQPYLPSVSDPGEISLVFLGGRFSHAVRKGAVLQAGADIPDRPWERMVFLGLTHPTPAEIRVANLVVDFLGRRFGRLPAYGRVDLLADSSEEPCVLELELIDPNLSLSLEPSSTDVWAPRLLRTI